MLNRKEKMLALTTIVERQENTAAVVVSIGSTSPSHQVEKDTLFITDAPAAILDALKTAGFSLRMDGGRMFIDYYGEPLT